MNAGVVLIPAYALTKKNRLAEITDRRADGSY